MGVDAVKIVTPPRAHNLLYWGIGLKLLMLNKVRHALQGYRRPRPFPVTEYDRAVDYDLGVVDAWRAHLGRYLGRDPDLRGRDILELGPGADLGAGLYLLHLGAARYHALDVNNLVATVPADFYERLFARLGARPGGEPGTPTGSPSAEAQVHGAADSITALRLELAETTAGRNGRLNYICRDDFDLSVFGERAIDLVVSQAAFEHFDDVPATIATLSRAVKPGGHLVVEIDLQTHTRWIRERDPLNIYRYGDWIYERCRFRGSPNRVRPREYAALLGEHGWERVEIVADRVLSDAHLAAVRSALAPRFRDEGAELGYLSIYVCATKT